MLSNFAGRFRPLGLTLMLVLLTGCGATLPFGLGQAKLAGTDLQATPAPAFSLTNADNQQISLPQFRGKAVALTFIYTAVPTSARLSPRSFTRPTSNSGRTAPRSAW